MDRCSILCRVGRKTTTQLINVDDDVFQEVTQKTVEDVQRLAADAEETAA